MERLYKGIKEFQQTHFEREKELFKRLSRGQTPDILFITCSDSRVDPNLMTQSRPGDLFILKNIGNIVPPYGQTDKNTCAAAALEFAVLKVRVTDIVVCGHSDCAAVSALCSEEKDLDEMPSLKGWLDTASGAKKLAMKSSATSWAALVEATAKSNIVNQLSNLLTYPFVESAVIEGKLKIHGWYFEIGTGQVYAYHGPSRGFERITHGEPDTNAASLEDPCEDIW